MAKLRDKNYIALANWMTELDLTTKEQLCYAIIYGFSQDGESSFTGSLSYLSECLGMNDRSYIRKILTKLVKKSLISKENKQSATKKWCEYKVTFSNGDAKRGDYIMIYPWMINELGLKDKELLVYALIYGFSKPGSNSVFSGSNAYIAKWLGGISTAHVNRYTSPLVKKGLLERIETESKIVYRALYPSDKNDTSNQNYHTLTNNNAEGSEGGNQNYHTPNQIDNSTNQNYHRGVTKNTTNILDTNTSINTSLYTINDDNSINSIHKSADTTDDSFVVDTTTDLNSFKATKGNQIKEYKTVSEELDKANNSYSIFEDERLMQYFDEILPYITQYLLFREQDSKKNTVINESFIVSRYFANAEAYRDINVSENARKLLVDVLRSFTKPSDRLAIKTASREDILSLFDEAIKLVDPLSGANEVYNKNAYLATIVRSTLNLE